MTAIEKETIEHYLRGAGKLLLECHERRLSDDDLCLIVECAVKLWEQADPYIEEALRRGLCIDVPAGKGGAK